MKIIHSPAPVSRPAVYFGKYRGTVIENVDPMQIGRIMAAVPDVLGETPSSWAMPCVPAAGPQSGMFVVPPVGSSVWIEFEKGEPAYPVWTGGFWATAAEVPVLAAAGIPGGTIVLQTVGQNAVCVSDSPAPATGGIVLKSADGASLTINAAGIRIDNGQGATLAMIGSAVTINNKPVTV